MQVTTKNIKKEGRLCMKSPVQDALCAKGAFPIQPPITSVNFSNNTLTHSFPLHPFSTP